MMYLNGMERLVSETQTQCCPKTIITGKSETTCMPSIPAIANKHYSTIS